MSTLKVDISSSGVVDISTFCKSTVLVTAFVPCFLRV